MKRLPNATGKPEPKQSKRYDADDTPFTRAHAALNQAWTELGDAIARYSHSQSDAGKHNLDCALVALRERAGDLWGVVDREQREAVA